MDIILGETGLKTSRICLGTVKFGRNTDVKYPSRFQIPDEKQLDQLINSANDIGINLIDTAPAYGDSEIKVGKLLSKSRQKWIISTKVGESYENNKSAFNFSKEGIKESVHKSLKSLRTETIDILLIHSNGNDLEIIEESDAVETLLRIKNDGLARYVGMSTKSAEGTEAASVFSDVIMAPLNLKDRSNLSAIETASRAGCGILLKKIFDSGKTSIKESLEFVFNQKGVHSAVVGTINEDHLRENVKLATELN